MPHLSNALDVYTAIQEPRPAESLIHHLYEMFKTGTDKTENGEVITETNVNCVSLESDIREIARLNAKITELYDANAQLQRENAKLTREITEIKEKHAVTSRQCIATDNFDR